MQGVLNRPLAISAFGRPPAFGCVVLPQIEWSLNRNGSTDRRTPRKLRSKITARSLTNRSELTEPKSCWVLMNQHTVAFDRANK